MARVTFGNIVAEARGHVGGVVFSRNTGGAYVRQKVSPVQPRTPAQLNQRSRMTEISKVWGTLTEAQRSAWKAFSLDFRKKDVLGLQKQRSAQQMFMFCNLALSSVGLPGINNPPVGLAVDAISIVTAISATSGLVQSVAITAPGSGYTSVPTAAFTGGGGSGAAGTVLLGPTTVASVTVSTPGTGYSSVPTVNLVGGGGTGATAVATIGSGGVTGISITNAGSGYTAPPTVIVSGGGGSGAVATSLLTATTVAGFALTAQGVNYVTPPTVTLSGGGGTLATAAATLTFATSALGIAFVPSTIPQNYEFLEVWATGPYPVGRTFVKSAYRYLALVPQSEPSPLDITEPWNNVFGGLPVTVPYKINVRVRLINALNGARSQWAVSTLLQLV